MKKMNVFCFFKAFYLMDWWKKIKVGVIKNLLSSTLSVGAVEYADCTPPTHNGATCWLWAASHKVLGQGSNSWAVIDPATEWPMTYYTPLWPLFGLTDSQIDPIWSIGWLCRALATMFYPNHVFKSALAASSQPLSFRC